MKVEIVRTKSETERERWVFDLHIDTSVSLYLGYYFIERKPARTWRIMERWGWIDQRSNSIQTPPLPDSVVAQAQLEYIGMITAVKVQT